MSFVKISDVLKELKDFNPDTLIIPKEVFDALVNDKNFNIKPKKRDIFVFR